MSSRIGETVNAAGFFLILKESQQIQFLLLRHSNRWDLPKGHCEKGEDFLETAFRELEEETGIKRPQVQHDCDFLFEISYPVTYPNPNSQTFQKRVHYFLGYLSSKPELTLTEHQSAAWHDWEPTKKIQTQTIDPLITAVANHLKSIN